MTQLVETFSKVILMVFLAILIMHMLNGTASQWIVSKIKAAPA